MSHRTVDVRDADDAVAAAAAAAADVLRALSSVNTLIKQAAGIDSYTTKLIISSAVLVTANPEHVRIPKPMLPNTTSIKIRIWIPLLAFINIKPILSIRLNSAPTNCLKQKLAAATWT